VAKKEMKLRKGDGYHVDILLICLINTGMAYLGTGWVSAPTIRSVTHATSLIVFSTNNPPGEKPAILGVKGRMDCYKVHGSR
jgi:solute carrier family 4 anion exchanger 2